MSAVPYFRVHNSDFAVTRVVDYTRATFQIAQTLAEAAKAMSTQDAALHLRYLQTLSEISVEKNSTIILTDIGGLLSRLDQWFGKADGHSARGVGEALTLGRGMEECRER